MAHPGWNFQETSQPKPYYPQECPCCEKFTTTVSTRRLNTQYLENERNYIYCCEECFEFYWGLYEEQWQDYYQGLI